jgi:hypothetical protein
MSEGKELLEQHLRSARFLAGAARGRWRFVQLEWPQLFVEVSAREGCGVVLKLECSGYPQQAPTAMPWDLGTGAMLSTSLWPRGGRVSNVFRPDWKNGTALYLPCDRQSIDGHPNWLTEYPSLIWKPDRGIVQYIETIHDLLQSHELIPRAA